MAAKRPRAAPTRLARALFWLGRFPEWSDDYQEIRRELNRLFSRRPWMCDVLDRHRVDAKEPNAQFDAEGAAAIREQLGAAAS